MSGRNFVKEALIASTSARKVAILGAGFAGLSVAYHLIRYSQGRFAIDLIDPEPLGKGASGISLGLLHPYTGKKAQRSWRASSCLDEVHRLLTASAEALHKPVILSKGIFRPAVSKEQEAVFIQRAEEEEKVDWWDSKKAMRQISGLALPEEGGGLFIEEGWTLHVQHYLEGLFHAAIRHGVIFKQMSGLEPDFTKCYDTIAVCLGANAIGFGPLQSLPMKPVKGQIIQLEWPRELPPLPMSVIADKQIVMSPDHKSCSIGSTYEHDFSDHHAHLEKTAEALLPKITPCFPALKEAKVIGCRAGFRASPKERFPLLGRLDEKFWFLAGLGSKGLLYHGWLGKRLARSIIEDSTKFIPPEVFHEVQPHKQS